MTTPTPDERRRAAEWTKTPPTEPGWYWWREDIRFSGLICEVDALCQVHYRGKTDEVLEWGGQWSGPLQEPGGDAADAYEKGEQP